MIRSSLNWNKTHLTLLQHVICRREEWGESLDNLVSVSKIVELVASVLHRVWTAGMWVGLQAWGWASTHSCVCGNVNTSKRPAKMSVIRLTCQWCRLNCTWASQQGLKVHRTHRIGVHACRGLWMSCKGLQTHWGASKYLRTAAESQTYLVQLCAEPCVSEPKGLKP